MRLASIDLGTNTCLLLIAEVDPKSFTVTKTLKDFSTVVRLGQGVDQNKTLHPDAIERTLNCLKQYQKELKSFDINPSEVIAVATSQARDAKNGSTFFAQIENEIGFRFRVISGDDEARLSFEGAQLPDTNSENIVIIDIGGGSTELMSKQGGKSLDIGCVRFTERYLRSDPVTDDEFWACEAEICKQLETMKPWRKKLSPQTQLLAVAGTATTLAAWFLGLKQFNAAKIDQCSLTQGDLHRLVTELKWRTIKERESLPGVAPGRADVLLAGALILWKATELLEFPTIKISTRGLRYGVFKLLEK